MKVVIDTNVLVVAISKRSRFYPIWQCLRRGDFELCLTHEIMMEYKEIVGRYLGPEVAENVVSALDILPNVDFISKYFNWLLITHDPDDDKFVDCAIAGSANYIVTNDAHFNVLKNIPFPKVEILDADSFLTYLLQNQAQQP